MYSHDFRKETEDIDREIAKQIVAGTHRLLTNEQINEAIRQFKLKGRMLDESEIADVIQSTK